MKKFRLVIFPPVFYSTAVEFNIDTYQTRRHQQISSHRGFTLIELIMVVVLLGVLAVVAAPKVFNGGDFNARGFHDETLSLLRYAQKAAVAQRRTVCIAFIAAQPANATLSIASVAASSTCNMSLTGPNKNCPDAFGGTSGCINARSGVSYSTAPSGFNFDGLGRPVGITSTLTMQVAVQGVPIAQTVFVEPETGYVHE